MPTNQPIRIVAHRGASHDAPENTLAAFRLAWQQDADAIEADFFLTADQQIACIHDRDTTRLAGRTLIVEESSYQQLRTLDVGRWKDPRFAGERIPLLRDVLERIPAGKGIVIELKTDRRIVPVLKDELQRFDALELNVLIISFDASTMAACKDAMPQYDCHWLTEIDPQSSPRQIAETVRRVGAEGVGMQANAEVIDARFVAQLRQHGCSEFHVWTVDDIARARHFEALGAVGITTNVPAVIGPAVRKR